MFPLKYIHVNVLLCSCHVCTIAFLSVANKLASYIFVHIVRFSFFRLYLDLVVVITLCIYLAVCFVRKKNISSLVTHVSVKFRASISSAVLFVINQ